MVNLLRYFYAQNNYTTSLAILDTFQKYGVSFSTTPLGTGIIVYTAYMTDEFFNYISASLPKSVIASNQPLTNVSFQGKSSFSNSYAGKHNTFLPSATGYKMKAIYTVSPNTTTDANPRIGTLTGISGTTTNFNGMITYGFGVGDTTSISNNPAIIGVNDIFAFEYEPLPTLTDKIDLNNLSLVSGAFTSGSLSDLIDENLNTPATVYRTPGAPPKSAKIRITRNWQNGDILMLAYYIYIGAKTGYAEVTVKDASNNTLLSQNITNNTGVPLTLNPNCVSLNIPKTDYIEISLVLEVDNSYIQLYEIKLLSIHDQGKVL